jgi:hypothetical protein
MIMEFDDLPKDLQEIVEGLKHGAYTIECEVIEALEDAKNLEEFKASVKERMKDLSGEAQYIADSVEG